MAAKKKTKTVTVELDLEAIKKLIQAVEALSELASASVTGCDDPRARALGKKKKPRR